MRRGEQHPFAPARREAASRPRLVLLADVRLYREGLVRALEATTQVDVIGSATVTESSLDFLVETRPDIVLLEAAAPRMPAVVHAILSRVQDAKIVAFAIADEEQDAIRCAEAGVSGYVTREASIEELVTTIVRVARGEFPCSPRVAALLARRVSSLMAQRESGAVASSLTIREREIIGLVDDGLSNKEIAHRLGIGLSTVKNHVHHILHKTRASRRTQAAARLRGPWTRPLEGAT
jgi:DNA-binding NarL/FixJ family response regulator